MCFVCVFISNPAGCTISGWLAAFRKSPHEARNVAAGWPRFQRMLCTKCKMPETFRILSFSVTGERSDARNEACFVEGYSKNILGEWALIFFNNFIAVCVVVFKPQLVYRPAHVHLVLLHHWSYSWFINLYNFILCFLHHWSVWVLCHWLQQWYWCFAYWCWGHGDGLLLSLSEGGGGWNHI